MIRRVIRAFWRVYWMFERTGPGYELTPEQCHAVYRDLPFRARIRALISSLAQPLAEDRPRPHTPPAEPLPPGGEPPNRIPNTILRSGK